MRYDTYQYFLRSAASPAAAYLVCAKGVQDACEASRAFAKRLFCEQHTGCGTCLGCRKFEDGNTVDFLELNCPVSMEEVRRIPAFLSSAAYEGGHRCIHIANAHTLTVQQQNFLLKTLEEPPEGVVFLLSLDNVQKVLGTIRSRCMEILLPQVPRKRITDQLIEQGAPPEQAAFAAAWSGGSPAQAVQLLADSDLADIRAHAAAVAERLATKRNPSMFLLEKDLSAAGKRLPEMLYAVASLFADAAVWPCELSMLTNPDSAAVIEKISRGFTTPQIQRIIELLNQRSARKQAMPQFRDDLLLKSLIFEILEVRA